MPPFKATAAAVLFMASAPTLSVAQEDPVQALNKSLGDATHNIFRFTFEERTRWEEKYGVNFGRINSGASTCSAGESQNPAEP
jgi:hypothetical protein